MKIDPVSRFCDECVEICPESFEGEKFAVRLSRRGRVVGNRAQRGIFLRKSAGVPLSSLERFCYSGRRSSSWSLLLLLRIRAAHSIDTQTHRHTHTHQFFFFFVPSLPVSWGKLFTGSRCATSLWCYRRSFWGLASVRVFIAYV